METTTRPESKLKRIPLGQIRESQAALRKVNKKDPEFAELVDSIRRDGVLNAISVREGDVDENGVKVYNLIDGLHRFYASRDAGLDSIPAQVFTMNQADAMKAQLIANVHKIETKPAQYSEQLIRILNTNPTMTLEDLATQLSRSVQWLRARLKIVNLPAHIQGLVDDKKIVLNNAYALADLHSLAPDEIDNYLDRAQTESPAEFGSAINQRVKAIRDARRQGKKENPEDANRYNPYPHLRKQGEIKEELAKPTVGHVVCHHMGAKTPEQGFAAAVAWVLRMDPTSVQEDTEAFNAKREAEKAEKEERKRAKEEKARREAAEATEEAVASK